MPRNLEDESLWTDVQNSDPRAFEILFDRYADFIYNFVFRRTGNWDVAEETVASVFAEAWRQRHRVETYEGSIRPWLTGVALNLIRRHWRQADRRLRASLRLVIDRDHSDHAADVAERLDAERRMVQIMAKLGALPTDQREVIELWAFEKMSYEEISYVVSVPVGTVRSRLHRARARLEETSGTVPALRASTADSQSQKATDRPDSEEQA